MSTMLTGGATDSFGSAHARIVSAVNTSSNERRVVEFFVVKGISVRRRGHEACVR